MMRAGKEKVGSSKEMTSMSDLPAELVGQAILTRVSITSLRVVRSTCKLWNALTKEWALGKAAAARDQFLGFMLKDSKLCSVRFHLCRSKDMEDEELLDLYVKQVDLLNQVEISRAFHCDGLLLCVTKDNSRLVVCNPYLGKTKWIGLGTYFQRKDCCYAFGYDINGNHKILRFLNGYGVPYKRYEIYDFSSKSWRVLNITNDWELLSYQVGVFVKGNSYFIAKIETDEDELMDEDEDDNDIEVFLIGFDFTTERFGPRLHLPFHFSYGDIVAVSCVREEKLAVLFRKDGFAFDSPPNLGNIVQIWVTTTIEPNYVSWSQFLRVEMKPNPLTGLFFNIYQRASFFIDEEEKVAVVFRIDRYQLTKTNKDSYHTAYIIGEDGYFRSVSLGVAPYVSKPTPNSKYYKLIYDGPPFVCSSSYRPSLVQVDQPRKRKERDD